MEPRTFCWISELGLDEEAFFVMQQELSTMNQYSQQKLISTSRDKDLQQSISSSESLALYSSVYSAGLPMDKLKEIHKADQHGLFLVPDAPLLLSFNQSHAENIIYEEDVPKDYSNKRKSGIVGGETEEKKRMSTGSRQAAYALDHIIAERRRREKLSQSFIALAAIIPGIRKMDKASVLGDAIKHIKELMETVKILEDKIERKTVEIATMNSKPFHEHFNDCESPSSVENNIINGSSFDQKLNPLEVDVKLCEKAVLVRIHCKKHKGVLAKVISMIEELHLKVNNFSAVPFMGSSFLDITMTAQVEEGCSITVEDVAKKLNYALSQCN